MDTSFITEYNSLTLMLIIIGAMAICGFYFFIEKRLEQKAFSKIVKLDYQKFSKKI